MSQSHIMPEEFALRWGTGLVRFPPVFLEGFGLSQASAQFLIEAGLPQNPRVFFEYQGITLLPMVAPSMSKTLFFMQKIGTYRAIATTDDHWLIALDPIAQERVVAGPQEMLQNGTAILVNSSISQYAESLLAWRTCMQQADAFGITALRSILLDPRTPQRKAYATSIEFMRGCAALAVWLETELHRIDPEVFSTPKNLWLNTLSYLRESN